MSRKRILIYSLEKDFKMLQSEANDQWVLEAEQFLV